VRCRAACVHALGMIGSKEALTELDTYLSDKSPAVLAELARYRNPLAFPAVREQLLEDGKLPDWCPLGSIRDLGPLSGLKQLQSLDLAGAQVTDLGPLSGLAQLQSLELTGSQVSDLGPLRRLTQLQSLAVAGTKMSDLGPLSGLTQLQFLDVSHTPVS